MGLSMKTERELAVSREPRICRELDLRDAQRISQCPFPEHRNVVHLNAPATEDMRLPAAFSQPRTDAAGSRMSRFFGCVNGIAPKRLQADQKFPYLYDQPSQ